MSNPKNLKFDWDQGRAVGLISGTYFKSIRNALSVPNTAAKFARFQTNSYVQQRIYSITPTGRFDPCLYYEIKKHLKKENINVSINKTESFIKQIYPTYNISPQFGLNLELRDYQQEIVKRCLSMGRGSVVLATAGGKTLTIASLIENVYRSNKDLKCLVIVPDLMLVNQTYGDFKEYGTSFITSKWTGNYELDISSNVIIANAGILLSDKSDTTWTEHIDLLIVDEVHKVRRSNKINKIIKKIRSPHKFGFTGTMPEELPDQWNITGKIGPVIYEKDSYALRQEDYISKVGAQVLQLQYKDHVPRSSTAGNPTKNYRKEIKFITKSPYRNKIITRLCKSLDNNALILVDYIEHGEILFDILNTELSNKQVFFIRGDVELEERDKIKKKMEVDTDIICIAVSKIFSTGISIKNLHYITFAGGGKAKVKTIQSIGRGLRQHKSKNKMIIFDIADQLHYGQLHSEKRIEIYKSENIKYNITVLSE
jgi:superfamily II DNA or RNA helicase